MENREHFISETHLKETQRPTHGDLVWVQCKEYRCLAFLDNKGNWINFYTGEIVDDFVKVVGQ